MADLLKQMTDRPQPLSPDLPSVESRAEPSPYDSAQTNNDRNPSPAMQMLRRTLSYERPALISPNLPSVQPPAKKAPPAKRVRTRTGAKATKATGSQRAGGPSELPLFPPASYGRSWAQCSLFPDELFLQQSYSRLAFRQKRAAVQRGSGARGTSPVHVQGEAVGGSSHEQQRSPAGGAGSEVFRKASAAVLEKVQTQGTEKRVGHGKSGLARTVELSPAPATAVKDAPSTLMKSLDQDTPSVPQKRPGQKPGEPPKPRDTTDSRRAQADPAKVVSQNGPGTLNNLLLSVDHLNDQQNPKQNPLQSPTNMRPSPTRGPPQTESSLTVDDHVRYCEFHTKMMRGGTGALMPVEVAEYQKLNEKVLREQEAYRLHAYNMALRDKEKYESLLPSVAREATNILNTKKQRVFSLPRYYKKVGRVPFDPVAVVQPGMPAFGLKHIKTVMETGVVPALVEPRAGTRLRPNATPAQSREKVSSKVVSQDENVMKICRETKVDFVVSSSSLCTLVDNLGGGMTPQWEIPVTIMEKKGLVTEEDGELQNAPNNGHVSYLPDDSVSSRVVIFDKPLIRAVYTPREVNQMVLERELHKNSCSNQKDVDLVLKSKKDISPEVDAAGLRTNFVYNLWNIDDKVILVRCRMHTYETVSVPRGVGDPPGTPMKQTTRFVGLKAKLEYQSDNGWEDITVSETTRWWISIFIRGVASMAVVNVKADDRTILKVDRLGLQETHPPDSSACLRTMNAVLSEVAKHAAGKYIVGHRIGSRDVDILMATEIGDTLYDLHASQESAGLIDSNKVHYIPIRWMGPPNRIPYTFPPQPFLDGASSMVCPTFKQTGQCSIPGCKMVHVAPKSQSPKWQNNSIGKRTRGVCYVFKKTGSCLSGQNCAYSHSEPESPNKRSRPGMSMSPRKDVDNMDEAQGDMYDRILSKHRTGRPQRPTPTFSRNAPAGSGAEYDASRHEQSTTDIDHIMKNVL